MKITVITVCYNAEKKIEETVRSVLDQTYTDIEYIVKDGHSTDNTLKILNELEKERPFQIYSEEDAGIYDAMNLAVGHATGNYIIFLNAGDIFMDCHVLEDLARMCKEKGSPNVLFGNIIFKEENGSQFIRNYSAICAKKQYYLSGDTICHQAIMACRESILEYPFNIGYSICADRDWLLKLIENRASFGYLDKIISICEVEGYSTNNQQLYEQETKRCIREHFPKGYYFYLIVDMAKRNSFLRKIMHFFGMTIFHSREVDG